MKIFIVKGRNMPPTKYRIYVKRRKTDSLIDDENIWVGNTPDDGRSKITSGRTSGPNYSYVEFNSWNELVSAITSDADFDVQPHVVIFNVNNHYTPQQVATLQIYASGDISEWELKEIQYNTEWFEISGPTTGSASSSITVKQKEGFENTGETDNFAFFSFYGRESGGGSHSTTVVLVQKCTKDYVDSDFEINAFALETMPTGDTAVTITSEAMYGVRVYMNVTCKRTYVSGERRGEVEEHHVVTDYVKDGGIIYEIYQENGGGFNSVIKCSCGGITSRSWIGTERDLGEHVLIINGNVSYGKNITGTYPATYDYPFMFNIKANQSTAATGRERQSCSPTGLDDFCVYYNYVENGVLKQIKRPLNIIQPYLQRNYLYPNIYFFDSDKLYQTTIDIRSYNYNSFDGGYVSGDVKFYHDANVSGIEYEFMVGNESDFSGITITSGGTPQEHGGYVGHFKFWTKPNKELEALEPKAVVRLWADSFGPAVPSDGSGIPERSFCDIGIRQEAAPDIKLMWSVAGSSLMETYEVNIPSSGWVSPNRLQYFIMSNGTPTKVIDPSTIDYEWIEPESGTSAVTVTITRSQSVINNVRIEIEENPYDYDIDFEFNLTGINVFGEKTYAKFIAHQAAGEG